MGARLKSQGSSALMEFTGMKQNNWKKHFILMVPRAMKGKRGPLGELVPEVLPLLPGPEPRWGGSEHGGRRPEEGSAVVGTVVGRPADRARECWRNGRAPGSHAQVFNLILKALKSH